MASRRERLEQLEKRRQFLNWFIRERFYASLTADELECFAPGGNLPEPLPNRLSALDGLDRKSLVRLFKKRNGEFGHRSQDEMEFYCLNGCWPQQRIRSHYFLHEGRLSVEWHFQPERGDQL
jgi:hypothetical protein